MVPSTDPEEPEIGVALAADLPVVPVLVGDAQLPSAGDLPEELRQLATRQAARVRDDSWHQDVDALNRRLEGETVVASHRRRWPWLAGAAAVAIVTVAIVVLLARGDGDGQDGGDGDGNDESDTAALDELPPCREPNDSWQPIELATNPTERGSDQNDMSFKASVEEASYRGEAPRPRSWYACSSTTPRSTPKAGSTRVEQHRWPLRRRCLDGIADVLLGDPGSATPRGLGRVVDRLRGDRRT